jgi:ribonuclease D
MIDGERLVALDIETSDGHGKGSLEPRNEGSLIALVQLAYEDGRIEVLRWNDETKRLIEDLIKEDYRFLIHNASFELDWFLVKAGLRFDKIWCTMIASQILNAGKAEVDSATAVSGRAESKNLDYLGHWTPLLAENDENLGTSKTNRFSHALQATVYRYANGAKIQKDQGNSDWAAELTDEQLRYAKDDVRYLIEVARTQWEFIKRFKMEDVAALEMGVAIAVNEMKYRGILIDRNQWLKAATEYGKEAAELELELNQ